MKLLLLISVALMPFLSLANNISVATNQWMPFINAAHEPSGTAAELLKQVLEQESDVVKWRYQNYDLALELVASGKQEAAFPYFKTDERANRVLYSKPIFSVTNRLYYNRQQESKLDLSTFTNAKFGRVAGYSYGEKIDAYLTNAEVFPSEKDALDSLFKNDIDFLPMTESVMNTMLNKDYKEQALLIKQVTHIVGHDSLHLIASKNESGRALIQKVNQRLEQVKHIQSLALKPVKRFKPKDTAKLISAEGYPAIVGQTSLNKSAEYYTLPQGTKVLVLKWSDKIMKPSSTDRIYKSMIDLSYVVVLNGPHVGKELFVKNMHLEIQ